MENKAKKRSVSEGRPKVKKAKSDSSNDDDDDVVPNPPDQNQDVGQNLPDQAVNKDASQNDDQNLPNQAGASDGPAVVDEVILFFDLQTCRHPKYKTLFLVFQNIKDNNEHYDYEVVDDDVNIEEDLDDILNDDDDDDNPYLRQSVPLSSIDIDIKIVRQKMALAEASLQLLRVIISTETLIDFRW